MLHPTLPRRLPLSYGELIGTIWSMGSVLACARKGCRSSVHLLDLRQGVVLLAPKSFTCNTLWTTSYLLQTKNLRNIQVF
jgi:hypothetical protein